jgi:hypothetical protein
MMHGYDSSKSNPYNRNRGCVYGQYNVIESDNAGKKLPVEKGDIPLKIKQYIDFMTQSLFGYLNAASKRTKDYNWFYFYDDGSGTPPDEVEKFRGEWIRHLYGETGGRGILAFDIELGRIYNEWIRGGGYDPDTVEAEERLEFFKPGQSGFFVPIGLQITEAIIRADAAKTDGTQKREYQTTSFYEFLKNFYGEKQGIDKNLLKNEEN